MATLDDIQARLSAEITRMVAARMASPRAGPRPNAESAAALAAEIEARLMQPASRADPDEAPSTSTACPTFTGPLQDEEAMPHLTDEIKTFIVKGLACYDTPSQVAEAVKAMFGIEVSRQQVYVYDPGCSQPSAQRWRDLHAATRAALLRELGEIGIAHRAVRLRRLDRLASRSERNNVTTALKCLEMAAKECGGMYENRKPIVLQPSLSRNALPEPAVQPVAAPPQPAAAQAAEPQPLAPLPAAAPSVAQQPSMPERAAPQVAVQQVATPQVAVPQPRATALSAPLPPAVPAQPPQPPALPEARPLSRVERHLAYVRDRHARDRAVAAEARLNKG
ncbi:DUF2280 domain-containing protein [Dongia sedimenti]|uniref:DUF2280 domain-containing protein n=1 Tax=Dongia sedimenti TaxID=3064282 RepID=A0ABU0YEK5_9PROT|nr:DUF2280 domain-containing protein [Rhodospirillaceae bacterium R-7]